MKNKIFIFGHYGKKNVGDDAMIYALLNELKKCYPFCKFAIFSSTILKLSDESIGQVKYVNPKVLSVLFEVMTSSIFIMGGGTQIYDYGKKMERIKVLFEICVLLLWTKLFTKKIYFLNIGIESLTTIWGRFLASQIFKLANFISVRDTMSYSVLMNLKLKTNIVLSFDLAALLPLPDDESPNKKGIVLGISILPFFEIYHNDIEKDELIVSQISNCLNTCLNINSDLFIHLFIFNGKSLSGDVSITNKLCKQLSPKNRVKIVPYNSDPLLVLSEVLECSAFIGMRYHSCLFAYLANKPLLIISYFEKCLALGLDIGLPNEAIIPIEELLNGNFKYRIQNLIDSPHNYMPKLSLKIARKLARKGLEI